MDDNPSFIAVTGQADIARRLAEDVELLSQGASALDELVRRVSQDAGDIETRWRAAVILGKLDLRQAVDVLFAVVDDPSWEVRHSAVWSLCAIGDERSFETIRRVCSSPKLDEQINYAAAIGLSRQFGERGAAALRENLSHDDENVRAWARAALANKRYAAKPSQNTAGGIQPE